MAKLYKHGHAVLEYTRVKRGKQLGDNRTDEEHDTTIYRLMSDGKVLRRDHSAHVHDYLGTKSLLKTTNGWKLAKLKPEIAENLDLLITLGFTKVTL